jgi:hypothetical protein
MSIIEYEITEKYESKKKKPDQLDKVTKEKDRDTEREGKD